MSETKRPLPSPTDNTSPFWEAAANDSLVVQKCNSCNALQFYPRNLCVSCASSDLDWSTCSGEGTVYTFTINHRGPDPYWREQTPYVVAMIELKEGVRMMSNIVGENALNVKIGDSVKVVFQKTEDPKIGLPQFEIA